MYRFITSLPTDLSLVKTHPRNTDKAIFRGLYFLQKSLLTGKRAMPAKYLFRGSEGVMTLFSSSAKSHTSVIASLNYDD